MISGLHAKVSRDFSRARHYLHVSYVKYAVQLALFFLIQNVGNAKQVPWREDVDVDLFGCPGIGMPENDADHVEGYAFSIQFRGEIVPKRMRAKPWYAGFHGKFSTGSVKTIY